MNINSHFNFRNCWLAYKTRSVGNVWHLNTMKNQLKNDLNSFCVRITWSIMNSSICINNKICSYPPFRWSIRIVWNQNHSISRFLMRFCFKFNINSWDYIASIDQVFLSALLGPNLRIQKLLLSFYAKSNDKLIQRRKA